MTTKRNSKTVVLALAFFMAVSAVSVAIANSGGHPLDPYPGFGRSVEAAARDDAIAYWEAYRRETQIATCMTNQGFMYEPAVAYPESVVIEIANYLGVRPSLTGPWESTAPLDTNRQYQSSLTPTELDAYFRALVGESAEAMTEADIKGEEHFEGFASGGCFGDAAEEVGSIWDLKRKLRPDFDALRMSFVEGATAEYTSCAVASGLPDVKSPEDIESRIASGEIPVDLGTTALTGCQPIWDTAVQRADLAASDEFIGMERHLLEQAVHRYADALDAIQTDSTFISYLSSHAAYAELNLEHGHPGD